LTHAGLGRAWGGTWRLALAAAVALPVCSLFITRGWSPSAVVVGLLLAAAAARPTAAWLLTVALVPVGELLGAWTGFGSSLTEALAIAFLCGWLLHEAVRMAAGREPTRCADRAVLVLALLLGLTVLASLLVRLVAHHLTIDFPAAYGRALFHFLWHDYFGNPSRFRAPTAPGLRLLEGIGLVVASLVLARRSPRLAVQGARVLAASAAIATLVSLGPLLSRAISMGGSAAFPRGLAMVRVSAVGPDVNAAGSFYALAFGAAAGLALADRRYRVAWLLAGALVLAGLWMTGSRAGLAAPALVAILASVVVAVRRGGRPALATAAGAVGLLALVGGYLYATAAVRTSTAVALEWRVELGTAALRMFAAHPAFGVGVGRFYGLSTRYASPGWKHRSNAHNNFLQVLAELGLVGLALLVGLVALVLWRAWRAGSPQRSDPLLLGLAGGLLAYVITWLAGHPLLVLEAAAPFWLMLGLVAGSTPASDPAPARWRRAVLPVLAAAIALSVIPRARAEVRSGDLSHAAMGFSSVHADARGQRFRWMARRARLFVPAGARQLAISFRSPHAPAAIKIVVNGRLVARLAAGRRWADVVFEMPPVQGRSFVPVDLRASIVRAHETVERRTPAAGERVQVGLLRVLR
jgi:O-antigen ligase